MKERIVQELDLWLNEMVCNKIHPSGRDIVEKLSMMEVLDLREEVYEMHCDGVKIVKR